MKESAHKWELLDQTMKQLEDNYVKNKRFNLFKIVRESEGKPNKYLNIVLDKDEKKKKRNGNINEVQKIRKAQFEKTSKYWIPHEAVALDEIITDISDDTIKYERWKGKQTRI